MSKKYFNNFYAVITILGLIALLAINLSVFEYLQINEESSEISVIASGSGSILVRDESNESISLMSISQGLPNGEEGVAGINHKIATVSAISPSLPTQMYDVNGTFIMNVTELVIHFSFGLVDEGGSIIFQKALVMTLNSSVLISEDSILYNFPMDFSEFSLRPYTSKTYTAVFGMRAFSKDDTGDIKPILTMTRGAVWDDELSEIILGAPQSFTPDLTIKYPNDGFILTDIILSTGVIVGSILVLFVVRRKYSDLPE